MIAWALLAAFAAGTDWMAVRTGRSRVEGVAKPAVMVALIGLAATADLEPASVRPWIVAALVFGLVGDLALLPQVDRFIVGLGSFLVGHLAYVVAFGLTWDPGPLLAAGAAGLVLLLAWFGRPIERSIRGSSLRVPVLAYVAVTCVVIVAGSGTGRWVIAAGALAFALSDGLLGSDRFVSPRPDRRVWIHVLYHVGQAAIVTGVLAGAPGS
ncbi:MAG: lysoplasmalogenase [Ilumatobacter sp.]|uniref:lysoplasmalogenase n=1 Tax=Ilumatobacter sp. TaxID=1967498 RepID=UPI003297436B